MNKRTQAPNQPRGHVFDGIQEYDNDMPRWWVGLFILTVIFAGCYMLWFHGPGVKAQTLVDELHSEQAEIEARRAEAAAARAASGSAPVDLVQLAKDPQSIAAGKEVFTSMCAACHGPEGQGLVGPNLADNFWLHGATLAAVQNTITVGVLEKGMPAWGDVLGAEKITTLVAYVASIQNTNPSNPKASQGEPGVLQ